MNIYMNPFQSLTLKVLFALKLDCVGTGTSDTVPFE